MARILEGSLDGIKYRHLWTAGPVDGQGLRTRHVGLKRNERVRQLRITPKSGDGYYSISELRAFCKRPKPWPPKLNVPPKRPGLLGVWDRIDNDIMVVIKGALAAIGTLVLLSLALRWPRATLRPRRWRDLPLLLGGD